MVKAVIERIQARNFRSFSHLDLEPASPTFIVGRNGAGKSNLLDAFQFLADAMAMPLSSALERRGGFANVKWQTPNEPSPPNLSISVTVAPKAADRVRYRYDFELQAEEEFGYRVVREECEITRASADGIRPYFRREGEVIASNVAGLALAVEPSALALPLAGGLEAFSPLVMALANIRTYGPLPTEIKNPQDPDSGISLGRDGQNAASVLREIAMRSPKDVDSICQFIEAAVPQTTRVRSASYGKKLSVEFTQTWDDNKLVLPASNMSDGTLRLLGILLAVYQNRQPSLMGTEEPESSLHPAAVAVLLDVLGMAADRCQLLVTTQSPEVLDSKLVEASNVKVVEWSNGTSCLLDLADVPREALRDHLMGAGELLRANQLFGGGARSTGPSSLEDFE